MKKILSADIGATNSRFGYFELEGEDKPVLVKSEWFKTGDFSSFSDLVMNLRSGSFPIDPADSDVAVFAIAGPVEEGIRSSPPFISWGVDLAALKDSFNLKRAFLINDFVAQAYACRSRAAESAEKILSGTIIPDATAAVIGAGTALGQAALVPVGDRAFKAVPSEGGHASFPFESRQEDEYREFLKKERGDRYITYNIVVSGTGVSYLHQFLTGEKLTPAEIAAKLHHNSETLVWLSKFYGRACRNYALEVLAMGGVYIAGGVAARIRRLVKHEAFEAEFRSSMTLAHILEKIPVFLIDDEESGLWGAAMFGAQELAMQE